MGTVKGNWLTGAHSGRACHHDDIYTKVDKKTGKCYSVKLCHPNDSNTALQAAQRNSFGMISAALSAWIKEQKALKSDAYKSLKAQYDRQSKYATLRGYMMAKGMAQVMDDKTVQISAGGNVFSVTVSGIGGGNGGGSNGSNGSNSGPSTGSGTTGGSDQGGSEGGGNQSTQPEF